MLGRTFWTSMIVCIHHPLNMHNDHCLNRILEVEEVYRKVYWSHADLKTDASSTITRFAV
jgi:hypothetical protein